MVGGGSSGHKQVQSQPVNVVSTPIQTLQAQGVNGASQGTPDKSKSATAFDDMLYYSLLSVSFSKLGKDVSDSSVAISKGDYNTAQSEADNAINSVNDYYTKVSKYTISADAKTLSDKVDPVMSKYKSSMEYTKQAINAHQNGDTSLETDFTLKAMNEMTDANIAISELNLEIAERIQNNSK